MFQDPTDGYKLHLYDANGSPYAPMFQRSTDPSSNMNPTRSLRNVTTTPGPGAVKNQKRNHKRNAGEMTSSPASAGLVIVTLIVTLAGSVVGPFFF